MKRTVVANTFGALGYMSVLFQWTWSLLLVGYPFLVAHPEILQAPQQQTEITPPLEISPAFTPFATLLVSIVTIIVLVVAIVTLMRLPKTIGRTGARITQRTATTIIPVLTHHKKLSPSEKKRLSFRVILALKLAVTIAPLVLLLFAQPLQGITSPIMWFLGTFAALSSAFYFGLQLLTAYLGKIDRSKLW